MHTHWKATRVCEACGAEFTREDGKRNSRTCPTCKRIERMEKDLVAEWEKEQFGEED